MMREETNQHLDAIGHHVENLGAMAQHINLELEEQVGHCSLLVHVTRT